MEYQAKMQIYPPVVRILTTEERLLQQYKQSSMEEMDIALITESRRTQDTIGHMLVATLVQMLKNFPDETKVYITMTVEDKNAVGQ